MFNEDEEFDLNGYKSEMILSLSEFISFFGADTYLFREMVYKILCVNSEEELRELELELCNNDAQLEKILIKQRINRGMIKEDAAYQRLPHKN